MGEVKIIGWDYAAKDGDMSCEVEGFVKPDGTIFVTNIYSYLRTIDGTANPRAPHS